MGKKKLSQKKLRHELMKTVVFLLVALVTVVYSTMAWFANNREVSAQNSSIVTETPSSSLFIALVNDATNEYYDTVTGSAGNTDKGLYPISTVDCKNWFYAKEWTREVVPESEGGDGLSTRPIVSGYAKATRLNYSDMAVTYTDSFNKMHTAFYKQAFNIYTDTGSLDVYLNPENPVSVGYGDSVTPEERQKEADKIVKALRIAITDSSNNVLVYFVPEAEDGKGNSMNAESGKYMGIKGTSGSDIEKITDYFDSVSISKITANKTGENEYSAKTSSKKLGIANSGGVVFNVYVWLEGTDAQALQTVTAGIDFPVTVTVSFVGVES